MIVYAVMIKARAELTDGEIFIANVLWFDEENRASMHYSKEDAYTVSAGIMKEYDGIIARVIEIDIMGKV